MTDIKQESLDLHTKLRGKIRIEATCEIETVRDLTLVYSPGVGAVSEEIARNPARVDDLTWRKNAVAIFSDGTAVLGLGDIGPLTALPVLEGKCAIFKRFSGIDAVPLILDTKDVDAIVETIVHVAPSFGAIQLEDISAPRCFEIERRLMERLEMPVMHDDQHGTAIVILAGLINALRVVRKEIGEIRVVMNGAGAAGIAAAKLLVTAGVRELVVCDRRGAVYEGREGLNEEKALVAGFTNREKRAGSLAEIAIGADVLIGVSAAGAFTPEIVRSMARDPVVFALANPVPEILPDVAKAAGVAVLATGRSDFPNQVNNALCYPGLFRGMLDSGVKRVTDEIKLRAARALAAAVATPTAGKIIPSIFEPGLHELVAKSVSL
ncbi:NADP-dependent malic enzyme [Candidatus Uhrbacteria bacterium]|nr:MAG: NADP-dependent malic enzyme [Candidatus Uhrbacteria bacterium]